MTSSRAPFTIYPARHVITMDRTVPIAGAVAVLDGRILGVGDAATLATWGQHRVDDRYADRVLMPGLIEGHSHLLEGGIWDHPYVGFYQRRSPDGSIWPALRSIAAVIERLQRYETELSDPNVPLVAWGFDPILLRGPRMVAADLDRVSQHRPIAIIHANFHVLNVNSAMLNLACIGRDTDVDGIVRDDRGDPTGELAEMAAMFPVFRHIGDPFRAGRTERAVWNFARLARAAGVTTAADLTNDLSNESVSSMQAATACEDFPLRVVAAFFGLGIDP
ncbi:MAG: amidohydrolase family protein, partial [Burkholderiaceae bacterium]